jgi:two-component system nitrogen regulation response regulator NtrX
VPSVLIIDDEPNIRRMVGALLQSEGYDVREAASGADGVHAIEEDEPDVALLDLMMPGELDGIATLNRIRERWTDLPVIMMSGRASLADAVKATKLGAVNFLEKPLSPETVLLALSTALELRQSRRVTRALREDLGLTGVMVGSSAVMKEISDIITRVAPTDSRVLIHGESGTGKELVAAAIHEQSARRDKPFIRVNCAAIPKDLVESEMFGHEKGSFTGATNTRVGRFELAHTGTLFLDEIGDLSIEAQAKLLRAIEAKEIQRVGGNKTIRVDVRVIAATNKDLARAVVEGTFREDLYFRLNVIPIKLPPLRERGDDVLELIHHFSALQYQRTSRPRLEWSEDALALMRNYPWPGNVRELANIVERIAILNRGSQVRSSDVMAVLPSSTSEDSLSGSSNESSKGLNEILEEKERALITEALARANGSVAEAARQLRTDRPNLYRRMKRLGITGSIILMLLAPLGVQAHDTTIQDTTVRDTAVRKDTTGGEIVTDALVLYPVNRDTVPKDTLPRDTSYVSEPEPNFEKPDTLTRVEPFLSLRHQHFGHHFGFGLTSGKVYNRVEGLPIHFGPTYTYTSSSLLLRARAYGIVRTARSFRLQAPHGGYDAHFNVHFGADRRYGVGARFFNVVAPIERWQMTEPENGLATFILHRDYLDYYNRHGIRGVFSWEINRKATLFAGYGEERWNSMSERDPFSIFRSGQKWRPNPVMDEGKLKLATLDVTLDTRNDERSPSGGWWITGSYEYGHSPSLARTPFTSGPSPTSINYGRLFVDIRRYNRISPRTQINGRLVFGGWIHGDELPLQRKVSLGGPGTLPGYDFRKLVGNDDVFVCSVGGGSITGIPTLCDRVFLGQFEFRTELASAPFSLVNNPALRIRSAGFTVNPQAVLFADVGRAWRTTVDWSSTTKADVGFGIDLGLIGVYVAKAVTDWSEAANFFVRVRRRF